MLRRMRHNPRISMSRILAMPVLPPLLQLPLLVCSWLLLRLPSIKPPIFFNFFNSNRDRSTNWRFQPSLSSM